MNIREEINNILRRHGIDSGYNRPLLDELVDAAQKLAYQNRLEPHTHKCDSDCDI